MTTVLDNAVERIQDLALALSGVTIKSAPDFPIENADPLPMCVAYAGGGEAHLTSGTVYNFPMVNVEFHFSRVNLRQMSQQINAVVAEFPKRLAGDPTLDGSVDTILMGADNPLTYTSRPFEFGSVTTQMLLFAVPVKILSGVTTTST